MRTSLKLATLIAALAGLAYAFPDTRNAARDTWNLWTWSWHFCGLSDPPGTCGLARKSIVDALDSSGHRDFFIGEVRTYIGPKEWVLRAYAHQEVMNPITGIPEQPNVVFIDDGEVPDSTPLPESIHRLQDWGIQPDDFAQPMYLVYFFHVCTSNAHGCRR